MRIEVDLKVCQNHGQCVIIAPEVFSMSAESTLIYIAEPVGVDIAVIEEAMYSCPTQAISIIDEE